MTRLSVKKPFLTIVAIVIILVIGFVSLNKMKTDLLPEISIPYLMVVTTEPGASPEKVEEDVSKPLESALGTISGVEDVVSNSAENYSIVTLKFTENSDMDSAMVRVSAAINKTKLPDICGSPNIMEIGMDMMATMYATVHCDNKNITELTDFTKEVVIPYFERQDGVANITPIGSVTETVEVRLNEEKINSVNDDILIETNDKLSDAKRKITKAKNKLTKAEKKLEKQQNNLSDKKARTNESLAKALAGLDQAKATKVAYEASLSSLQASKSALEGEKKAYENNNIKATYDKLNGMFTQFNSQMGSLAKTSGIEIPADIKDAIDNPDKYNAFAAWITGLGYGDGLSGVTVESLQSVYNIVNVRIPQIDTELANLATKITAAQMVVNSVNEKMKDIDSQYEKALDGALSAAAGFGSGDARMSAGKTQIQNAKKELDDASDKLKDSTKAARENANLDKLLTLDALSGLIYAQNFAMPAGYIDDDGDNQWLLKVGDEYSSIEDISSMVLCKVDGVGAIKLSDVADVTLIDNADQAYTKYNGEDTIMLAIYKSSTANASEVSDRCKAAMSKLEKENDGLKIVTFSDQSEYISLFLESVLSSILIGAILAIIVLALFLKSIKPTLVVAFSIPFSVLFAIIIMYFSGININVMSLAGLALAIGMLVDNSIVVIENICRLRAKGMSAPRAAVQGTKQVAAPIIASTITTICVFLPMIFTTGMVKDLIVPFALTISYALTASLLVALTVVPSISSLILNKYSEKKQPVFGKIQNAYGKALSWCLKYKIVTLAIAVVLLAFSVYKVFRIGIVMIPSMSGDTVSITATVPEGYDNDKAVAMADEVLDAVLNTEGVKDVCAMDTTSNLNLFAGGIAGKNENDVFAGFSYMIIPDENINTIEKMKDFTNRLKDNTKDIEGDIKVGNDEATSSMLSTGISVRIYGDDLEQLISVSDSVMDIMGKVDGIIEIDNGIEDKDKAIHLVIDKDKVAKKGLTVAGIYQTLSEKLKTDKDATTISLNGSNASVNIVNETDTINLNSLMDLELTATKMGEDGTSKEKKYHLSDFATTEEVETASIIKRENQEMYIEVTSKVADGKNATLLSRELEPLIDEYQVPDGCRIAIQGEAEDAMDMVYQMVLALALGLLLIYLVMVAQFQSLLSPFIVLFTVPLAFTGGLIGLIIANEEISAMSLMGFMVLMGTVVNNGIVFVDYVNQLRIGGLSKRDALIATGKTRIRPILMTALTTILAMSNMIFTKDISSSMSKGMAIVIAGGLLYSTLMTLFVVPIMYDILFRRKPRVVDLGDDLDEEVNEAEDYMRSLQEKNK